MSTCSDSPLPPLFRQRLERILPAQRLVACWRALHEIRDTAFRVNTLKTDAESLLAEVQSAGLTPSSLAGRTMAYSVPAGQRRVLTQTGAFMEGRLYIQNPASMLPPLALAPEADDWVLDLAAAPGSKTLQLAALMRNQGRISAVESVRSRFFRLRRNLEQGGATNVHTYLRDGRSVWRACPEQFDRVLLDAPCSGEGRFNAAVPQTYAYWSLRKIREMVRRQRRLLFSAVNSLKPGGLLVYATCTFAPEENEGVISWALRRFAGALAVEEVDWKQSDWQSGLAAWEGLPLEEDVTRAVRIPPDGVMEGFFVCVLRKRCSTLVP